MDGWDREMDRGTSVGQTDWQSDGRMDGWANGQVDGWTDRQA